MEYIKHYVRNLLGLGGEEHTTTRPTFKRDRIDDDPSLHEGSPALKRHRTLPKSAFPDIMSLNDWDKDERSRSKVRYVPIQFEGGPSTSTPNIESQKLGSQVRSVPIKLVDVSRNGTGTPARRPRIHTPVRPVIHAVIDDDDDDNEVTWVETKPRQEQQKKSNPKVYINLDDEDDDNNDCGQPEDVIFVKKITTPPPVQPYKFFVTKNRDVTDSTEDENRSPQYYRILKNKKLYDRNTANVSPKQFSKFKAPPGITKAHKRSFTPVPRWMQPLATSNASQARNRYLSLNGNARSAISEVFNLDEKRSYQELIRKAASSLKQATASKPFEIINLAEESASFRSTQRSQKKALDDIKFVERGVNAEKASESTREYDPVTVASINSSDSEVEVVPSESSTSSSIRIDPVNSLRDSYKDKAITSEDWLAKLESKYKKKRQDTQEKLKDARRDNDIISKVNYEQKLAHLEYKLKYELSIPESLIEEAQPAVELPELTPEQEKLVNRALGPGPPGQLLVEKFNLRIHRRDLQTLAGLNWLNDEVINFYMNLLMQRSEQRPDLPKVYATNTFFYPKLMQGGQPGLRRWTRKIDIFAHDLMVIPVHLGVHWCLSLIDFRAKRVAYLDSMGGRNQACLDALLKYLHDEHQDKKGQPFDSQGWKTECLSKNIPQQMNGSDCGMFSCTFAEFSARDAPYTFSQQHMPYLRRKAALEILQGKLLL
ncbi:sentrin-specific protease 1 [Plutella xylostella]|uniref:sentrin-specific protease 1 n=1 Tax=Plutella xylostella TaxID=51655 RepID=UPI0020321DCA|nr:sentrin-specific protease 1 [Plutella xylostella]